MKYRYLGRSGLKVSELCLGTMVFGEQNDRGTSPQEAANIIDRFLDAGGNHIDTANVYAGGRSEEIVGSALAQKRANVVLATKVRFSMGAGANDQGLSRVHIINAIDASLRRLGTDYIDLLYMHCWDPLTPIEESLRAFNDLVSTGKVRYIGVSNFKAWQLMKALAVSDANGWPRFVAAQYQYSLVVRDIEREFIDLCQSEGVGITPWGPLGGGFLSGKYQPNQRPVAGRLSKMPDETEEAWHRRATSRNWAIIDAIESIAGAHAGVTYAQIALAWLLNQPQVASVILGVRTIKQLEDNLGPAGLELSDAELHTLGEASALTESYPYRFIETYGGR